MSNVLHDNQLFMTLSFHPELYSHYYCVICIFLCFAR